MALFDDLFERFCVISIKWCYSQGKKRFLQCMILYISEYGVAPAFHSMQIRLKVWHLVTKQMP